MIQEVLRRAWIVIPAYRESEVMGGVVEQLRGICSNIVVVDDGSKDETGSAALAGGAIVLTHIVNLGQGAALQTGIEFALQQGAEYIFTFDADGQHAPDRSRFWRKPCAPPAPALCLVRAGSVAPRQCPACGGRCCGWPLFSPAITPGWA